MTSERQDMWSDMVSKATAVKVRNVMNPLLWLNAVAVPACIGAAIILQHQLALAFPLMLAGIAVPLWTLREYDYFAKKEPHRLQSEEFLIEQQRLMLQSKGSRESIDATAVASGSNPELLEHGEPEDFSMIEMSPAILKVSGASDE